MTLINDRFMLTNSSGYQLYHQLAKLLPIIDFHCHLEAKDIYENRPFDNITQLWLGGDHYKWRAMRANGIPERKITGDASAQEKFQAWAETVEASFGNPIYHWSHLELAHYFNITTPLNSKNWLSIMNECNKQLRHADFLPQALIRRSGVEIICTTDNPLDDLTYHRLLQQQGEFAIRVLPSFRPDDVFTTESQAFQQFISQLERIAQYRIESLSDFLAALEQRIDYFHLMGCRISDHGLQEIPYVKLNKPQQEALFHQRLTGKTLTDEEMRGWNSMMLIALAAKYKQRDWAMQIHFGALRNNNANQLARIGINSGFDSIGDQVCLAANLNALLNAMAEQNALPKTIIYNLNPAYNDVVASCLANFQTGEAGIKSPLQFGAGWWFNDTQRGMRNQLSTLADQGLLFHFIGMLTDSRSFVSYTRHDYFRRILCDLIGGWVERGEVPEDKDILASMIKGICVDNARRYFSF